MNFKKGDKVKVSGLVVTKDYPSCAYANISTTSQRSLRYGNHPDPISRNEYQRDFLHYDFSDPIIGVVAGWSTRISGIYRPGSSGMYEYDPGDLRDTQIHKVIMVIPCTTERWVKPIACIENDLELIKEQS